MDPKRASGSAHEKDTLAPPETKSIAVINDIENGTSVAAIAVQDHTVRKLKPRHIQLIGIAGTIGTA